ncbi:MAG: aminodeoxychorismate synthase component I [bacterium]
MFYKELDGNLSLDEFIYGFGQKENFYLLDGGDGSFECSPYSYIGTVPIFSVYQVGERVFYEKDGVKRELNKTLLEVMKDILAENKRERGPFPFSGGFIGYFTYDFGWMLDKFKPKKLPKRVLNLCLAKFNWYEELFVFDNREKGLFFVSPNNNGSLEKYLKQLKREKTTENLNNSAKLKPSVSKKRYFSMIDKTKQYIANGDIYQANITQRFSSPFYCSPEGFYCKLRQISPAPFGAYLNEKRVTIICNSPERFLFKEGDYIETRPIKGTRKRAKDKDQDSRLIDELLTSEKDRAEHIMIVDLERNDLGKICETGTVHVKELMRIESYANVHHLVSIVAGRLKSGKDIFDCIKHTFPGGSITGAPKLRSMEIIDELEPVNRGVYCGSIGYIDASGDADLNIAIRTGVVKGGRLFFNVGGGIVADSDAKSEYEETITKAKSFLAAMGLSEVAE